MELKDLVKVFKKHKRDIFIILVIGTILGIGYYYTPKKYYTTGSVYITRRTEGGPEEYFKYEGYYSQQAASAYTENVISTLQSVDLQSQLLANMKVDVTRVNLLKLKKSVIVKRSSPQLITITIKGNAPDKTLETWNDLVNITTSKLEGINTSYGDGSLKISKMSEPITTQNYYPIYICVGTGMGLGLLSYILLLIFKNYEGHK